MRRNEESEWQRKIPLEGKDIQSSLEQTLRLLLAHCNPRPKSTNSCNSRYYNQDQIALMCAEKDPLTCHRAILICQHLRQHPLTINHILKTGELESHHHLENRLLNRQGFSQVTGNHTYTQLSLFEPESNQLTREECLEKAYPLQGNEIAYVETEDSYHD